MDFAGGLFFPCSFGVLESAISSFLLLAAAGWLVGCSLGMSWWQTAKRLSTRIHLSYRDVNFALAMHDFGPLDPGLARYALKECPKMDVKE